MLRRFILLLLLLPSFGFANTLEDVIYKKDGSVLRGSLIEQDFEKGSFKIQINGGSVFVIPQAEVAKITKEPLVEPDLTQPSSNYAATPMPSVPATANTTYIDEIDGVLFIGTSGRSFTDDSNDFYHTDYLYSGWNIGGQKNFNQHVALYSDINIAKLSEGTRTYLWGYEEKLNDSELSDTNYFSLQLSLLLSTNQYKGWQFFTGIGRFKERFSADSKNKTYEGEVYHLGLGYSWQSLQLLLRVNLLDGDHPEHLTNNTNGHLQLGFNFE